MVQHRDDLTVPKVGRAAVCVERGPNFKLELREDYPVPSPGSGEILIRLRSTGICMSDHHMIGDWGLGAQADCPGHEGSGVVVALGEGVQEWKIGDRAGVKPCKWTCGRCDMCTEGFELNCPKRIMSAYFTNGTYAQYLVHPADYASRIPDNLPDHLAAPILCAGATVYRAVKQSKAKVGQWLVVTGAGGGVGSLACQYARASGCRVIGIDTGASKKDMCLKTLRCEAFVDFKEVSDVPAEVLRITGKGAHAVIVTGGVKSAYQGMTDLLRVGGTLVCVGLPSKGEAFVGAEPLVYVLKQISIRGTLVGSLRETDEALKIAASGDVKPFVTVYPFARLKEAVADLHEGRVTGRACVNYDD